MCHKPIITIPWVCLMFVSFTEQLVLHSEQDVASELANIQSKLSQLENRLAQVEMENIHLKNTHGGSVYIHWGKTSCHGNRTSLIYKGFAGGNHYNDYGGGVNTLCLPDDPTWNKYNDAPEQWVGNLYGVEVDASDTSTLLGNDYHNQDVPCAVCKVPMSTVIMVPGRANCYPGWTQQYTGYLMSGQHSLKSNTDYICLDAHPEAVPHGQGNDDEHVLYFTEATCGSLPCPPYANGRELACAVCSQ